MRWFLKTIFFCHVSNVCIYIKLLYIKNRKRLSSVTTCHFKKLMEKSEEHYSSHKKEERVRPECSILIAFSEFLISRFICQTNCRNLKSLYKNTSKAELVCNLQKRSRYKMLNVVLLQQMT